MASSMETVMSEVHVQACPPACGWWSSSFRVAPLAAADVPSSSDDSGRETFPPVGEHVDSDGDLDPPRRVDKPEDDQETDQLTIYHFGATCLRDVGLQVWRGSLLLGDLALHVASDMEGTVCVELGSGTGLTGLLLARAGTRRVYITDIGQAVLANCECNVRANCHPPIPSDAVKVRELDWRSLPGNEGRQNDAGAASSAGDAAFRWTADDLSELHAAQALFAGDTIYGDDMTDAFLECIGALLCLPSRPMLYLAMEKRWNFTLADMDSRAPAFDHFMRHLGLPTLARTRLEQQRTLVATQLDVDSVPQRLEYERGKELELWTFQLLA
eukprot:jgi/Tetstr1/454723/TSEL_041609.t1